MNSEAAELISILRINLQKYGNRNEAEVVIKNEKITGYLGHGVF